LPSSLFLESDAYYNENDSLLGLTWGMRCTQPAAVPPRRTFSGLAAGFAAIFQTPTLAPAPAPVQLLHDLGVQDLQLHVQNFGFGGTATPSMSRVGLV
jgi:hypothetical protein